MLFWKIKKLYHRVKYRKQLKLGYGLLTDQNKRNFVIVGGRAFVMNGKDPLVRVDLTNNEVEQYKPPKGGYKLTYKVKAK